MQGLIEQLLMLACQNVSLGRGGPFAAAVVRDGVTLAYGTEQARHLLDPTAHAEMLSIRAACQSISSATLEGAELWTIFDPCFMCLASLDEVEICTVRFVLPLEFAADRGWIDMSLARPVNTALAVQRVAIDDPNLRQAAMRQLSGVPLGDYGQRIRRII